MPELDTAELVEELRAYQHAHEVQDHGDDVSHLIHAPQADRFKRAADTIDALRTSLDLRRSSSEWLRTRAEAAEAALAERDRIIADAPHAVSCATRGGRDPGRGSRWLCNCWKSQIKESR